MGDKLSDLGVSVQWNTELVGLKQDADKVSATLRGPDGTEPDHPSRLGRRLRRCAQLGARAQRHCLPRRALRARVLRRRHGGDREHGPGRGQHLPVARGLPPAVSHARQGPLAHRRHSAADLAWPSRRCDRRRDAFVAHRGGSRPRHQGLHLVLHLPHPSPLRRPLPRPALLPARRCRPHSQPGRRARHEHRPAGRLQPGLEARPRRQRHRAQAALLDSYEQERLPVARRLLNTTDRAFRLVVSDSWLAGLLRTKVLARIAAFAMRRQRDPEVRVPHRLPDRHPLPRQRPVAIAAGCAGQRAARRRSLPLAAIAARGERPHRGPVPAARRHALQPPRHRPAAAPVATSASALCCASTPSPPTPPTTPSWPAPTSPTPPSTSCAPTAMSAFAELPWMPWPSTATSRSACTCASDPVAQILPDVLGGVQLGAGGRQVQRCDVGRQALVSWWCASRPCRAPARRER